MKRLLSKAIPSIAIALSTAMSTIGVAQADVVMPYGTGTTTFSFMNVSTTSSTVVATYYRPDGTIEPGSGANYTVAKYQRIDAIAGRSVPDGPLPSAWQGSVILSSDQDLTAVAVTQYTGRLSGARTGENPAGTEMSAYDAFSQGSTTLFAPLLSRVMNTSAENNPTQARITSRFTLQNTTGSPITATLQYRYAGGGNPAITVGYAFPPININIQSYGSVTFDSAKDGASASDGHIPYWNSVPITGNWSLRVDAGGPIVGVVERSWNFDNNVVGIQNYMADYTMMTPAQAANTIYSPAARRQCINNSPGPLEQCGTGADINGASPTYRLDRFNQFTFYTLQNTSASQALVSAKFYYAGSSVPSYTLPITIPAYSSFTVNLFNRGDVAQADYTPLANALGSNFNGSVVFEGNQALLGVGFINQPNATLQNYSNGFNLVSDTSAAATLYIPRFDRQCTACVTGSGSVADFTGNTVFNVMNVGTSAVTLNAMEFYTATGDLKFSFQSGNGYAVTLQPGGVFAFNARVLEPGTFSGTNATWMTDLNSKLSGRFTGSVRIVAPTGSKLIGVVTLVRGTVQADAYNAIGR